MPIQPFNSVGGFSVGTGNSLVIDRNAGATFSSLYVTNGATFNSLATFVRGINTHSLYVSQGATFASTVRIDAGLDVHSLSVDNGATFDSTATFLTQARFNAGLSSGGTVAVQSLAVDAGATFASQARFVAGLSSGGTIAAQSLSVDQGATFAARARFVAGLSSGGTIAAHSLSVDRGATFSSTATFTPQARFVAGLSSGGTIAAQSLSVDAGATFAAQARFAAGLSSGGTVAVQSLSVDQGATFSSTATFTPQARFVAGLSSGGTIAAQSLSVDQGATFASQARFVAGLSSGGTIAAQSLSVDAGATFAAQARFTAGLSSGGTVAVQSLSVDAGATFNTVNATTYRNLPVAGYDGATGVASFASHGFVVENGNADVRIVVTGSGNLSTPQGSRIPIIAGFGDGMHPEARGKIFSYYSVDDTFIGKTGDSALQTYVYGDFTVFGDAVGKTFGHSKYTFAVDPKMGSVLVFGGHTTQLQNGTVGHTATPRIALIDARNEFNQNNIYTGVVTGLTAPKFNEDAANKWYVDSRFAQEEVTITNIRITQGATFTSRVSFLAGLTTQSLYVSQGATFASQARFESGLSSSGNVAVQNLSVDGGATFNTVNATTYRNLPQASDSVTGVASFNSTQFTVASAGQVSLASAYQVTGDTIVGGNNIGTSRVGNTVTVSSTHPIASASATGVASFNSSDFVVSAAGAVSLTDVFTGGATFTAAVSVGGSLTAQSLFVSQGATFASRARFDAGLSSGGTIAAQSLSVDAGATFAAQARFVAGLSSGGTVAVQSLSVDAGATFNTVTATTYRNLPQASNSVTGVASFNQNQFEVSSAGNVALTGSDIYFDTDLTAAFGPNKTFGKYVDGDTIPAKGKTAREVIQLALFDLVPPSATLSSNVPSAGITFGEFNPKITLTLQYTPKTLGATAQRADFWFRRGGGAFGTTFDTQHNLHPASSVSIVHTYNSGDSFATISATPPRYEYQCVVTDSLGATALAFGTPTSPAFLSITAAAYAQPTITFNITGPSAFSSPTGQEVTTGNSSAQQRMLGNRISRLSAVVTRSSAMQLVPITSLGWQYGETSASSPAGMTFRFIDGVTSAVTDSVAGANTFNMTHAGHTGSIGTTFGGHMEFAQYRVVYTDAFRTATVTDASRIVSHGTGVTTQINFRPVIYYGKSTLPAVDDITEDIPASIDTGSGMTTNRLSLFTNTFSQLVSSSGQELVFPASTINQHPYVIIPKDVAPRAKFEQLNTEITPLGTGEFVAQNEYGATGTFIYNKFPFALGSSTIVMKNV